MNYNNFAKTFSDSRKNMKWEEIDFFTNYVKDNLNIISKKYDILDI